MNLSPMLAFAAGAVATVLLAGCATTAPVFPKSERVSLQISPGNVSLWTETAANDYLIPDSQLFVGGRGSLVIPLGLVGALVSQEVNRSRNQAAIATAEDSLRLRFVDELRAGLGVVLSSRTLAHRYAVAEGAEAGQIFLLPSAKLTLADDGLAELSLRLTTRFRDAATKAEAKKEYFYFHSLRKSIAGPDGWSADHAAPLKRVAAEAMAHLAAALIDDIEGLMPGPFESVDPKVVTFRVPGPESVPRQAVLLKDYRDHVAVAPKFGERAIRGVIYLVDRRLLLR